MIIHVNNSSTVMKGNKGMDGLPFLKGSMAGNGKTNRHPRNGDMSEEDDVSHISLEMSNSSDEDRSVRVRVNEKHAGSSTDNESSDMDRHVRVGERAGEYLSKRAGSSTDNESSDGGGGEVDVREENGGDSDDAENVRRRRLHSDDAYVDGEVHERRSLYDSDSTFIRDSDCHSTSTEMGWCSKWYLLRVLDRILAVDVFYFVLLALFFVALSVCMPRAYKYTFFERTEAGTFVPYDCRLSTLFLWLAMAVLCTGIVSSLLFGVSRLLMAYVPVSRTWFILFGCLTCHLAVFLVCLLLLLFFTNRRLNILQFARNTNLDVGHIMNMLLFADILLALKTFLLKKISLMFNYSNYLERIRLVVLDEYFKNFLKGLKDLDTLEASGNVQYWKTFLPHDAKLSQEEALTYFKTLFCDNIKKKAVEEELITAFDKLYVRPTDPFQSEEALVRYWTDRANRIYVASTARNMFSCVGDFAVLFPSRKVFTRICKLLNVSADHVYDRPMIFALLERRDREHLFLKRSFEQNNAALDRVGYTLSIVIALITLSIFLGIFLNRADKTLDVISAIFGTGFILNSAIKEAITSTVFVFCVKPYEVGDRIFVTIDNEQENLVVTELNVLSTTFRRFDGVYVIIPNITLSTKAITNVRRSGIMSESHIIQVSSSTPVYKIELLKYNVRMFLHANRDYYTQFFMLNYDRIEESNRLFMRLYMQYTGNWQNYEAFLEKRTYFLTFLNRVINELGITYVPLRQNVRVYNGENKRIGSDIERRVE